MARISTMICGGLLTAALAIPALAQDANRYTMNPTDDGYVRLDTMTGEVSICRERGEQMVCQLAADDREAFERQLDSLEDRVAALESAIGDGARDGDALPTDEEIDRTMGIMETFMRRFFSIVEDLNRDFDGEENSEPAPDRT
ncbi:hypothetical protein [Pararhizobium haloflavum]|uniref:hypothetical protein n=1 Tax=Pararhizobium haloflavum TaxID=2037914 RepID=UPI000C19759B|nr:hypothetical protein [Pararhizobium haloflavum]